MNEKHWRINDSLRRVHFLRRQVMDRSFDEFGVTPGQHFVLMRLGYMGRIPSQVQIAEEMHVTPASVARTVKSLDAEGFIERASGTDGRKNEIRITGKGEKLIERSHAFFQEMDALTFAGFSDEELGQLQCMLDKMLSNLNQIKNEGEMNS